MTEANTERVTMLWPTDLKTAVREKVGHRGLTNFTVAAVNNHLGLTDVTQEAKDLEKQLSETKYLVQLLADRLAMGGDSQDRREAFMELDLPHWIQTDGWPAEYAALVKPEPLLPVDEEPTSEQPAPEEDDEDLHRPMALVARKDKPAEQPAPAHLPHDRQSDDFLSRVQAKAAEKGIDLGNHLRPASSIPTPAEKPDPEPEVASEPASELEVQSDAPTPVATPAGNPNACPKCGDELVVGECWTCA